jgi:hypothetical protein
MLVRIKVEVQGESALLMHRYPMEEIKALEKKAVEQQAEIAAYRDGDSGNLYIPGVAVQRALVQGATYSKGKGRASLQKVAAACLIVGEERLDLGVTAYAVDSRPVVIPSTGGRILRHRPRLDKWRVQFTLEYDPDLLKESEVREIVDNTGQRVGLLDFRPACKGPFGRFKVVGWVEA